MKELILLVAGHRLGGVEVREGDFHFRVSAQADTAASAVAPAPPSAANVSPDHPAFAAVASATQAAVAPPPAAPPVPAAPEPPPEPPGHVLASPIVGTFYAAPSPDAEPYVRVGDRVQKGQVVCIIEAMKLMNEIESDVSGVVRKIHPENAQPVEFGEPLFVIETN